MGKHIEEALEKCDKLPKELVRNLEKQCTALQAGSVEAAFKWHNEDEVKEGDVVVELVYRVRQIEEE